MFARVLFPTDFSIYANSVFACIPDLKSAGVGEVVLLKVIREIDVPLGTTYNIDSLNFVRYCNAELLNIAKMALEGKGFRVIVRIEYGSTVNQLLRVADEERVDLIFMESQGRSTAEEMMYGSLTQNILRNATIPVLVQKFRTIRDAGHEYCQELCRQMFSRVLYPTDFGVSSEEAFRLAKRLKAAGTNEIFVLYVQPKRGKKFEQNNERIDEICRALLMFRIEPHPMTRVGIPSRVSMEVANEIKADMILVGLNGQSQFHRKPGQDTFDAIVRSCPKPVLVVTPRMKIR